MQTVNIQPLTAETFAAFGDVIQSVQASNHFPINKQSFERYHALSKVELSSSDSSHPVISIFKCNVASTLPYTLKLMEKHPLASQAIIPWSNVPFIIAVAKDDEAMKNREIYAFESNGKQGINLAAGTWHMPLIAPAPGLEFLVVDRESPDNNCVELQLEPALRICHPSQDNLQ